MLGLRPLAAVNTICRHLGQHSLIPDRCDVVVHAVSVARDKLFHLLSIWKENI